jgi:predicted ABC-type ATPase
MPSKNILKKEKSRFRIFAGPNGSGKSSLFNYLKEQKYISTEIYINADKIEKQISLSKKFSFNAYRVKVSEEEFKAEIKTDGLFERSGLGSDIEKLHIKSGILNIKLKEPKINSYLASFICVFLAKKLFETGSSFCYETVMSHPSKIELYQLAKEAGYSTYLYYVTTESWKKNSAMVALRVAQGGHSVSKEKIEQRYIRSMQLLPEAIKASEKSFLFDNSKLDFALVGAYENGNKIKTTLATPAWLLKYINQ